MFYRLLFSSFKDLLPIIIVISFFQLVILQSIPEGILSIITGLAIVVVGLALFMQGLEIGIFPIGESLAHEFAKKASLGWLLLFAFLIGFATTVAEPALIAIAEKASVISHGRIDADILRITVALSVGFAIALGSYRIIAGHPIHYYILTGYILTVILTYFTPPQIVGLAYDSGGVTTSTVTVPLVAALGIGLAQSIKGRNPVIDGFGLIAFASLTPMIFVQLYGIFVYSFAHQSEVQTFVDTITQVEEMVQVNLFASIKKLIFDLFIIVKDVLPILFVIFFFQYAVIRQPLANLKRVLWGIVLVIFGLYAFIIGLEMGLFPIGEAMALALTSQPEHFYIYLFGFLIGFSTTMAEPALLAIANKADEISGGIIKQRILRIAVALGVATGIALGTFRIIHGEHIYYYIITGYIIVIILTFFSPRHIIPIAYDSGGVTTSTVTVPLVAALGLGLASNIEGRSPLIDGFGLIAFASLFPMVTVMLYAIISQRKAQKE